MCVLSSAGPSARIKAVTSGRSYSLHTGSWGLMPLPSKTFSIGPMPYDHFASIITCRMMTKHARIIIMHLFINEECSKKIPGKYFELAESNCIRSLKISTTLARTWTGPGLIGLI